VEEAKVIATVHFYSPRKSTFQTQPRIRFRRLRFPMGAQREGTPSRKARIERVLDGVAVWASSEGRPVYFGEFGVFNVPHGVESKARWLEGVARETEHRGMSWAVWDLWTGFGMYQPALRVWRQELLDTLISRPQSPREETADPTSRRTTSGRRRR
jgi:endoglucanase